jgi:large subunit ribosomal protein L17
MRHRCSSRKFGRNASHRQAMFSNLVTSLFRYERIQTTEAKAKELRSIAEKLITLGKRGDLHARRLALRSLHDREVLSKLFDDIAPRNAARQGGYTRLIKLGQRPGDGAPITLIELVEQNSLAGSANTTAAEPEPSTDAPTE